MWYLGSYNYDFHLNAIFHKTTAIGLFTNYLSFTPLSYKIGLVKTLIHRAFKICSNWCLFQDEVHNIKKCLEKNSYQMNFIDREIKAYLGKQLNIEPPKPPTIINFPTLTIFLKLQNRNQRKFVISIVNICQ